MISPPPFSSLSKTDHSWVVPPLDGSHTIPQILHFNYLNNANEPLFVYADVDDSLQYISWHTAVSAAFKVAIMISHMGLPKDSVVAIFAKMDFATYWAYIYGILISGYQPFPISPRNSSPIVAHLLKVTSASAIIINANGALHKVAMTALNNLEESLHESIIALTDQPFDEIFENENVPSSDNVQDLMTSMVADLDSRAMILHSSGSSSAFPKPIYITHRILIEHTQAPWYGDINMCGKVIGAASLVLFHVMGILFTGQSASMGSILAIFAPNSSSALPTPDSVMECYKRTSVECAACVPSFLEKWAETPAYVDILKNMTAVAYSGGPLHKPVGDMLAQQGVSLITIYGMTECGTPSEIFCYPQSKKNWEYFRISKMVKPVFEAQNDGTKTVEVYFLPNALHTPAVIDSQIEGCDCYATKDLLEPHPEISGLWKIYGRSDSQIILLTGEKTNPGPIEAIICESPLVKSAVMFGRGRSQNGIILEPYLENSFDPKNLSDLAQFRSNIRPFIDRANAYAPSHSRLVDDLVLVASPSKPFSFTGKGTPRRGAIVDDYSEEIHTAYAFLEETSSLGVHLPSVWIKKEIDQFVDELLSTVLNDTVEGDSDIFHAGCSSLQATQIQSVIHRALKEHGLSSDSIPSNFVYLHPTPRDLADALTRVDSNASEEESAIETAADSPLEYLEYKYTEGLSLNQPKSLEIPTACSTPTVDEDIVLMTGSTGALGCALLFMLAQDPTVSKVYAINRLHKGKDDLQERQRKMLDERGIDSSILQNRKIVLIEADILSDNFGLSENLYAELRSNVTRIIHTAWSVRWDMQVTSFEPQIASVRRIVDFALKCSTFPLIIFTSSIGVLSNWPEDHPAPELPVSFQQVVGSGGYAESKWVGEQILLHASKTTNLHSIVVRVGQLTGLPNGAWNASEWVPSIIRSANALGCLPDTPGDVSWLPMMSAAHFLAVLRHPTHSILHLVHPSPVSWHALLSATASMLNVPLVPYAAWLAKLELFKPNKGVPATLMLPTFRSGNTSVLNNGHEALGAPKLSIVNAVEYLPAFKEEKPLGRGDVEKWIGYWKTQRFL